MPDETVPSARTRNLSVPAVSIVNTLAAGNLIEVSVSPVWMILSAIDTSLKNVDTPVTVAPPPTTLKPDLAVTIPTESTLVTSS